MSGIYTKIMTGFYITITATFVLAAGCRKKHITREEDPSVVRFSVVSAPSQQNASSRAKTDVNNDFSSASQIGIYATKGEDTDVRLSLPENTNIGYSNPTGSTQWLVNEGSEAIRFFKDNQAMNFYAYHPYTAQVGSTVVMSTTDDSPTLIYSLPVDQSDVKVLSSADLMWGKKNGAAENLGPVNLEFTHKLSKLSFKITSDYTWGSEALNLLRLEVFGDNMYNKAKLHISSGTLSTESATQSSVYCAYAEGLLLDVLNEQECQFIVVPTSLTDMQIRVTVFGALSGEKTYTANVTGVELPGGHMRQMTMKVHKENKLTVLLSAQIKPWDVIGDINIDGI